MPQTKKLSRQQAAQIEAAKRGLKLPTVAAVPMSFRDFVTRVRPNYCWYKHCEILASILQRVADGELKRLMIFMPPRHGKSEMVSRLFSAYWLYRRPHQWIGLNSYGAELAYTLSRAARENYHAAGGAMKSDAVAVKHWETPANGGMWAAGVGGPITGKGFDLGIIDDPLKNAEESFSSTIRDKHKEWYGSTFYTRGEPGSAILIIQTRWHEEDLSGWLLGREKDEGGEDWWVLSMPALSESEDDNYWFTLSVPRHEADARGWSEDDRLLSVDECSPLRSG